jgi:tetratricopeptide (TPR) repeat protein
MKIQLMNDIQAIQAHVNNRHIMIVEPNTNYRNSIRQFFSNMKVSNLAYATSSKEALHALHFEKKDWALIICEWTLPDMNGIQLCREIRNDDIFASTQFLLLSVENLRSDIMIAGEVKVDGYLLKPFSYEEFVAKLLAMAKAKTRTDEVTAALDEAERKLSENSTEAAEVLFEKALAQKPNSARALHGLALIQIARGNRKKAIDILLLATTKNRQFLESYRTLLELFEQERDWNSALRVAKILHEESPDNPKYVLKLAQSSMGVNDLETAEANFRKVIRLSPRLAAAFKGLGDVNIRKEDYEAAMGHYHKALDLESNDVSIINSIALTYVRIGKLDEGIKRYQVALRLEPENAPLLFNLGYAHERKGDFSLAINYYKEALIIEPNFEKAQRFLLKLQSEGCVSANGEAENKQEEAPAPALRDHED